MRTILLLLIITAILSCSSESQNSQSILDKDSINIVKKELESFSSFRIDSVSNIKKGINERSSTFIKNRLESLIGEAYKERCEAINVIYPPKYVLFRAFKYER